jgi:hypothetical protein
MLKTVFRFLALTSAIAALGTALVMSAANAATPTGHVPLCSKTIIDQCVNRPASPVRDAYRHQTHKLATGKSQTAKD